MEDIICNMNRPTAPFDFDRRHEVDDFLQGEMDKLRFGLPTAVKLPSSLCHGAFFDFFLAVCEELDGGFDFALQDWFCENGILTYIEVLKGYKRSLPYDEYNTEFLECLLKNVALLFRLGGKKLSNDFGEFVVRLQRKLVRLFQKCNGYVTCEYWKHKCCRNLVW